ncbi:hypothetical protein K0U27_05060 [archaeon]|nr:hypothetical protein [archaeon]
MGETDPPYTIEEELGSQVSNRSLNNEIIGGCLESDPNLCPQFALDCYPYTHQWSAETQSCEIW